MECQPFRGVSLTVLMRTPVSQFRMQGKKCRIPAAWHDTLKRFCHTWTTNRLTEMSGRMTGISQVWFKQQAPSGVQSSTLECALSMSHNVAVTLGWYPSVCFFSVCVCLIHSTADCSGDSHSPLQNKSLVSSHGLQLSPRITVSVRLSGWAPECVCARFEVCG